MYADQNGIPYDSTMRGKSPVHVAIERKNLGVHLIISIFNFLYDFISVSFLYTHFN